MRTWIYCIVCGLIFAAGYHAGRDNMRDKKEAEIAKIRADYVEQIAQNTEIANGAFAQMMENQNAALEEYAKENAKLRRVSDNARAAVERLRGELSSRARLDLENAPAAARDFAATAAELLGNCAAEYRSMAQAADEHAADARLMREAWPKMPAHIPALENESVEN